MKKLLLRYTLITFLVSSSGCSNLLDVDIVSDITNEGYWKTEGDMESYLFGTYTTLRTAVNTTYHMEDRGDTFVPGLEAGLSSAWNQNLSSTTAPDWRNYYSVIHHCNLILKYGPKITTGDQANKNRIMAETYFIRAFTYFWLVRSWGDVPIELEPTESDTKPMLPRSPAKAVMDQILADIEKALALFPEEGFRNKSRASKPATYALKADALLWKAKVLEGSNQDLEAVIEAADKASAGLNLENTFWHIYATDKKNGQEVIFSIYFNLNEKADQYSSTLKPRDIFVQDAVNKDAIAFARSGARSAYSPSPKLEAAYDKNPNDVRKKEAIIKAVAVDGTVIGVFDNKMRGTSSAGNRFYDSDINVYRLAEMFLFKAEALAALNRTGEAVTELNKVRARAKTGDYTGPMDKLSVEREILDERFRELYLEQKRWPDLLRFHYEGVINVYDEVPNLNNKRDLPLYFPIPRVDIDRNPNLVQTVGYSE